MKRRVGERVVKRQSMNLSLKELITATGGRLTSSCQGFQPEGVSTDSRSIKRGEIFFALKGDRFDGHDYIFDALKGGASGVVAENIPPDIFQTIFRIGW